MDVRVTHHVDKSEQRPDGFYDYYYEYDTFEFDFGSRVIRARRYSSDPPGDVHVLGVTDANTPHASLLFYDAPEAAQVVTNLKKRGLSNISVLGPKGYRPLDAGQLKDAP